MAFFLFVLKKDLMLWAIECTVTSDNISGKRTVAYMIIPC